MKILVLAFAFFLIPRLEHTAVVAFIANPPVAQQPRFRRSVFPAVKSFSQPHCSKHDRKNLILQVNKDDEDGEPYIIKQSLFALDFLARELSFGPVQLRLIYLLLLEAGILKGDWLFTAGFVGGIAACRSADLPDLLALVFGVFVSGLLNPLFESSGDTFYVAPASWIAATFLALAAGVSLRTSASTQETEEQKIQRLLDTAEQRRKEAQSRREEKRSIGDFDERLTDQEVPPPPPPQSGEDAEKRKKER